jgi:hypothetical protein
MHLNYYTVMAMALTIFIPGMLGVFKFNYIRRVYRPFIYLIWIGCANEVISIYCAFRFHNNIANNIIYTFAESVFLLWFFKELDIFKGRKHFLNFLIFLFAAVWFTESFVTAPFGTQYTSYFDTIYAFCIVMFSVDVINRILLSETDVLKNPVFLICVSLIIFFSFQIVERMFWVYGLKYSVEFRRGVQQITIVVNLLSNFIYGLSVLWMQKRRAFTLQF